MTTEALKHYKGEREGGGREIKNRMKMNRRRMKEEQESFDSGHVTTSIRKEGEKEIVMGVRIRQEEDEVINDYEIATMTSVMDARR